MYTYLMDNYDLWKIYDEDQERRRAVNYPPPKGSGLLLNSSPD